MNGQFICLFVLTIALAGIIVASGETSISKEVGFISQKANQTHAVTGAINNATGALADMGTIAVNVTAKNDVVIGEEKNGLTPITVKVNGTNRTIMAPTAQAKAIAANLTNASEQVLNQFMGGEDVNISGFTINKSQVQDATGKLSELLSVGEKNMVRILGF